MHTNMCAQAQRLFLISGQKTESCLSLISLQWYAIFPYSSEFLENLSIKLFSSFCFIINYFSDIHYFPKELFFL